MVHCLVSKQYTTPKTIKYQIYSNNVQYYVQCRPISKDCSLKFARWPFFISPIGVIWNCLMKTVIKTYTSLNEHRASTTDEFSIKIYQLRFSFLLKFLEKISRISKYAHLNEKKMYRANVCVNKNKYALCHRRNPITW